MKGSLSRDLLWLSVALLPLLFIAVLLPLSPHDYWWYLRLGQDILTQRAIPRFEPYSYPHLGEPVLYQPWLAAVILWLAYAGGGLNLTFLLRYLFIAAAYALLWAWTRRLGAGPRLASILTVLAGLAGSSNWSFRPQMFAFVLFALSLLLLWEWQHARRRSLWLLPAIACVWANLHNSFLMLYLLVGSALLFGQGDRRRLLRIGGLAFLATLLTPFGAAVPVAAARNIVFPLSRQLSAEWLPPSNLGWQMNLFFGWLLALLPVAAFSPRRLTLLEWAWLLGLSWMALGALRYVIWALFLFAACTAAWLAEVDRRSLDCPTGPGHPPLNMALATILFLLPLLALPGLRARWGMKSPPAISPDTPVAAAEWLNQHPELRGPLWSDITFASYLIFASPSRPIWIDTRFEFLYRAREYERFASIAQAAPGWEAKLDEDGINLLMVSSLSEPNLLRALQASPNWCRQYQDDLAAIYSRRAAGEACP